MWQELGVFIDIWSVRNVRRRVVVFRVTVFGRDPRQRPIEEETGVLINTPLCCILIRLYETP